MGVATARGGPYYGFASLLRGSGIRFDAILPEEAATYGGDLVLTTRSESASCAAPALYEDLLGLDPAVARGMLVEKLRGAAEPGDLVFGVDPGSRTGLSVEYCGAEIEASSYPSPGELGSHIAEVMSGLRAARRVVRIGDGDAPAAGAVLRALCAPGCPEFELEVVDEHDTSPRGRNRNQGGKRDMLSARSIRMRGGRPAAP
ncbi:MAG: hypothetical protein MPJ02_08135 [Nitrosopumilus sp.]|nr:hypothetical protein [Nitrosopumilus sp.]MDA7959794.1 hypothetical protein [Nitrosopumilus sp.]MDA7999575.1 hypothetical protein [Nitrosopumilus sp.]